MSDVQKNQTLMAFDFGEKRIGVAIGNTLTRTSEPLTIIGHAQTDGRFAQIQALLHEWQPQQLIVGLPLHPDGTPHAMTEKAKRFGNQLAGRFHLPVTWVDERYSSVEVDEGNDALAAQVILQQYLNDIQSSQDS